MKKEKNRSLKLGILVTVGLGLFTIAIYFLGSQKNLFSSSITIKSYFNNVSGLVEGNKVRYSGITIGSVSEISIVSDSTILVEMTVNKKVGEFIRRNSKVEIGSDGLMGSKIVNILPGTPNAGSVSDNDFLKTVNPIDLQNVLEEAKMVIDDGRVITKNLIEITNKINSGDGDLALLLNENNITARLNKASDNMVAVTEKAFSITEKIDEGEGDLGRLVNDTTITTGITKLMNKFERISYTTDSISSEILLFSKKLNSGDGIVQRLVYDRVMADNIDTAIVKVNCGVDHVIQAAETIEKSWIFNLFSKKK